MERQKSSVSQSQFNIQIIWELEILLIRCSYPPEILISLIWGMALGTPWDIILTYGQGREPL